MVVSENLGAPEIEEESNSDQNRSHVREQCMTCLNVSIYWFFMQYGKCAMHFRLDRGISMMFTYFIVRP
jgi:hypothetical protein